MPAGPDDKTRPPPRNRFLARGSSSRAELVYQQHPAPGTMRKSEEKMRDALTEARQSSLIDGHRIIPKRFPGAGRLPEYRCPGALRITGRSLVRRAEILERAAACAVARRIGTVIVLLEYPL